MNYLKLNRFGLQHTTLNAKNDAKEAAIVAQAGQLGAISISGDTLQINKKLAVRGNITTYWDGADQFVVYSGHNARRGYFGMYDSGAFKVNG